MQLRGQVGVLKVRLFRPWDANRFMAALPKTCKRICVLDRTKDGSRAWRTLLPLAPFWSEAKWATYLDLVRNFGRVSCFDVLEVRQEQGSQGEPLFLEVSTTLKAMGRAEIVCIGGAQLPAVCRAENGVAGGRWRMGWFGSTAPGSDESLTALLVQ